MPNGNGYSTQFLNLHQDLCGPAINSNIVIVASGQVIWGRLANTFPLQGDALEIRTLLQTKPVLAGSQSEPIDGELPRVRRISRADITFFDLDPVGHVRGKLLSQNLRDGNF